MDTLFEITHWLENVSFSDFKEEIENKIIGQPELPLVLSQVYSYLDSIVFDRPINHNIIIAAPSGSGKTETYRALKEYFAKKIPSLIVSIRDTSQLTAVGYKGIEPVEIISDFVKQHSSIGLCFLDEFDKKLTPSVASHGTDINAEVQSNLLTIIEGTVIRDRMQRGVDTSKIMFIGMGSFNTFRQTKEKEPLTIGFEREVDSHKTTATITKENIVESGGLYELVGRFPVVVNYFKLEKSAIKKIIRKVAQNICNTYTCDIVIEKPFEDYLIKNAFSEFGCRLIDSIIREAVLREYAKSLLDGVDERKTLVIKLNDKDDYSHEFIENKILEK